MIDYTKPTTPIPQRCGDLINMITSAIIEFPQAEAEDHIIPLNQLTVNEYHPGQGIASHTGMCVVFTSKFPNSVTCFISRH
jgi:hypothetical protein